MLVAGVLCRLPPNLQHLNGGDPSLIATHSLADKGLQIVMAAGGGKMVTAPILYQ